VIIIFVLDAMFFMDGLSTLRNLSEVSGHLMISDLIEELQDGRILKQRTMLSFQVSSNASSSY
jgi:hypothetical protein